MLYLLYVRSSLILSNQIRLFGKYLGLWIYWQKMHSMKGVERGQSSSWRQIQNIGFTLASSGNWASASETPRLDGSVDLKLWILVLAATSRICLTGRGGKAMPSRLYLCDIHSRVRRKVSSNSGADLRAGSAEKEEYHRCGVQGWWYPRGPEEEHSRGMCEYL